VGEVGGHTPKKASFSILLGRYQTARRGHRVQGRQENVPSLASKVQFGQTSLPCSQKMASLMSREEVELLHHVRLG
jgi:hypothetical protein